MVPRDERAGPGADPQRVRPRHLGECAAATCSTFYLGTGPGSARRYCSAACASWERVAAHRRRARGRS
ncbi:CGNR zinc finger domain-containing protein [Microbispora siamensis]